MITHLNNDYASYIVPTNETSATPMMQHIESIPLKTLTLEKNSVLVARIPQNDFYDHTMMQSLYNALTKRFPYHQVFVWYDDVDFMAIHDHGYPPERITCNDTENYY